jgi:hypothetical protein
MERVKKFCSGEVGGYYRSRKTASRQLLASLSGLQVYRHLTTVLALCGDDEIDVREASMVLSVLDRGDRGSQVAPAVSSEAYILRVLTVFLHALREAGWWT